jgi:hypothetical protein
MVSVRRAAARLVENGQAFYVRGGMSMEEARADYRFQLRIHTIQSRFAETAPRWRPSVRAARDDRLTGRVGVALIEDLTPGQLNELRDQVVRRYRSAMSVTTWQLTKHLFWMTDSGLNEAEAVLAGLRRFPSARSVVCVPFEPGMTSEFALVGPIERSVAALGDRMALLEVARRLFGEVEHDWQPVTVAEARLQLLRIGQVDVTSVPADYLPPWPEDWFLETIRFRAIPSWAVT